MSRTEHLPLLPPLSFRRVDGSYGALTFLTEKSRWAGIAGKHTFARAAAEQTFDPREVLHSMFRMVDQGNGTVAVQPEALGR